MPRAGEPELVILRSEDLDRRFASSSISVSAPGSMDAQR